MTRSIPTEDRISTLPDPIICHILSFLPTKIAAITTILSKRWNRLWLSVPTLHFDDRTHPLNYNSFRHFVSFVFLLRDITLPIRSFHLQLLTASKHDLHDVNRFVYAAVQQGGIENLNLEIDSTMFVEAKLPLCIFSCCKTLVDLRLEGLEVNDLSHVVVDFPLLKTLHLSYLFFKRFEPFVKLLSGCPILEELLIDSVYVENMHETLVLPENHQCLPNLIRANISNLSPKVATVPFTLLYRAVVLCVELGTSYNHFPTFQNLTHMELILKHEHCEEWQWVIEVLKRCPKLQNLTIHEDSKNEVEDEVVGNWMDPTIVPECLSNQLRTCLLKGYTGTECEVQFAKYIMQNAKVLNSISIKSVSPIDINVKYQMISKLASLARASPTCELLFD